MFAVPELCGCDMLKSGNGGVPRSIRRQMMTGYKGGTKVRAPISDEHSARVSQRWCPKVHHTTDDDKL